MSRAVVTSSLYTPRERATWAAPVISTHAATQQDVAEQAAEGPHCERGGGTVGAEWYTRCASTRAQGPAWPEGRVDGRKQVVTHAHTRTRTVGLAAVAL